MKFWKCFWILLLILKDVGGPANVSRVGVVPSSTDSYADVVELTISARNLYKKDYFSPSDPFCIVYIKQFGSSQWTKHQTTETVFNKHNPEFSSKIKIKYEFAERQELMFELYDQDGRSQRLAHNNFIGYAICTVAQVLYARRGLTLALLMHNGRKGKSSIIIEHQIIYGNHDEVLMGLRGHSLANKDIFSKSDPFIEIRKKMPDGRFVLVIRTEWKKDNLNPVWDRFSRSLLSFCDGDYEKTLKFDCFDWNRDGKSKLIGSFQTTLNQLISYNRNGIPIILKNKTRWGKRNAGQIFVYFLEIRHGNSFTDFIRAGLKIHCTIAIDFTSTNGNRENPTSLHYTHGSSLNFYEQAIISIVSIIENYDSDNQFPVLGFGAIVPPNGHVSHEFYVNMSRNNPYCSGVNGVLSAYRNCIMQVHMYGPTHFAPVIQHVTKFGQAYKGGLNYFILLILTSGIISDYPQTAEAIVVASSLPISIVIVGLGNTDFTQMQALDGDIIPLESNGIRVQRDIVQFVAFSHYYGRGDLLGKEVLAEIPKQVHEYMTINRIIPNVGN